MLGLRPRHVTVALVNCDASRGFPKHNNLLLTASATRRPNGPMKTQRRPLRSSNAGSARFLHARWPDVRRHLSLIGTSGPQAANTVVRIKSVHHICCGCFVSSPIPLPNVFALLTSHSALSELIGTSDSLYYNKSVDYI